MKGSLYRGSTVTEFVMKLELFSQQDLSQGHVTSNNS